MSETDTLGRLMEAVARIEAKVESLTAMDAVAAAKLADLDARLRGLEIKYERGEASYRTIIALLSVCGIGTVAQLVTFVTNLMNAAH